jgi:hypothetical protein
VTGAQSGVQTGRAVGYVDRGTPVTWAWPKGVDVNGLLVRLIVAEVVGYVPGTIVILASARAHDMNFAAPVIAVAGFCLGVFLVGFWEARYSVLSGSDHLFDPAWQSASITSFLCSVVALGLAGAPGVGILILAVLYALIGAGLALPSIFLGYGLGRLVLPQRQ